MTINVVLARKLGLMPPEPEAAPQAEVLTPMRQMRRAMARAADKAVGLPASVLGIAEEEFEADALIEQGPQGWVVIGLRDGANTGLTGLFLIDPALRSALVEMQTMGKLLTAKEGEERKVTRADTMLTIPFATQLLEQLGEVGFGGSGLNPTAYDLGAMEDLRTAGLVMMQGTYQSWRITVQIGGEQRQGEMMIAMRPQVAAPVVKEDKTPDWTHLLQGALSEAPTELEAVLARVQLPMSQVEAFEVDQLLPLAGITVGSIRLVGPNGEYVTMARLGQVAGKRAVRIEVETIEMQESTPRAVPVAEVAAIAGGAMMDEDGPMGGALEMANGLDLASNMDGDPMMGGEMNLASDLDVADNLDMASNLDMAGDPPMAPDMMMDQSDFPDAAPLPDLDEPFEMPD